jgi:putative transposase
VAQLSVNQKCILRLMREHHLLVPPNLRLRAKRTPTRSKPRPTKPNEWWGIDMTKVLVSGFGWVYIVVILDWYTKKVVGCYAGLQCPARHWLAALDMAVNRQFPNGARDQGLCLMSDNGCQPTSTAFIRACSSLGIHQASTSYGNPKGNADTERFIRTLKEDMPASTRVGDYPRQRQAGARNVQSSIADLYLVISARSLFSPHLGAP